MAVAAGIAAQRMIGLSERPSASRRAVFRLLLLTGMLNLCWPWTLYFTPDRLGSFIGGDEWIAVRSALPGVSLFMTGSALSIAAGAVLRALGGNQKGIADPAESELRTSTWGRRQRAVWCSGSR